MSGANASPSGRSHQGMSGANASPSGRSHQEMTAGRFVGLDVNGTGIQVAVRPTGEHWSAGRDDRSISEIADRLQGIHPDLVVMEAAGSFELPVAGMLATAGLPFALVPPRNIREFAKAIGRIRQDQADLLAYFAELVRPEVRPLPSDVLEQLRMLKTRRQEIREMLAIERPRLSQDCPSVLKDVKSHVFFLERSLITIGDEINRTIRTSCAWR